MYVHCQEKGKRMERSASPTQVRRARREEWRTTFCSRRRRERSVGREEEGERREEGA